MTTLSAVSGGKFANGAITAASRNLFNAQRTRLKMRSESRKLMSKDVIRTVRRDEIGETETMGPFSAAGKLIIPDIELIYENP